jgi:methionyl-tRNA formyltransferase
MIKGKGTVSMLMNVLKRSGIRGFSYKVGTAVYSRLLDKLSRLVGSKRSLFSPLAHAELLGIPVETFTDVNSDACLARLRSLGPDLVFGINVYQKVYPPFLSIPAIGVVNCHFGMLPNYRGMSPYMWALANDEKTIGITAHFMDEEFDTGDIIAQEPVAVRQPDSAYHLYLRGCVVAAKMLTKIARMAEEGSVPRRSQPREGSYYSLPGASCVKAIRSHGHKLVRVRELIQVARGQVGAEEH